MTLIRMFFVVCLVVGIDSYAIPPLPEPAPTPAEVKGWFGIGMDPASPEEQKALSVERPVPKVIQVFRGSPAENSGVKVGEFVLSFAGQPVKSVVELVGLVSGKRPGTEVEITLGRLKGESRTIKVVLDLRPSMRGVVRDQWLNRKFPKITVKQVSPKQTDLVIGEDTQGKVLIIDYFATWCGPCKQVIPVLQGLRKSYHDKGFQIVSVSSESPKTLTDYLKKYPVDYAVTSDVSGEFRKTTWVSVMPTLWVIDRKGVVRHVFFGAGHGPAVQKSVKALLETSERPVKDKTTKGRKTIPK